MPAAHAPPRQLLQLVLDDALDAALDAGLMDYQPQAGDAALDPLHPLFDPAAVHARLARRRSTLKRALLDQVRRTTNVMDSINSTGKLEDDAVEALKTAVAEVKRDFRGTKHGIEPGHEEHEPLDASAVDQERIVRK